MVGTRLYSVYGYSESYTDVLVRIWQGSEIERVLRFFVPGRMAASASARSYVAGDGIAAGAICSYSASACFRHWLSPASCHRPPRSGHGAPEALSSNAAFALMMAGEWLLVGLAVAIAVVAFVIILRILLRLRSGSITVRYIGHGTFKIPRGTTILEASRANAIPHPAQCGGAAAVRPAAWR